MEQNNGRSDAGVLGVQTLVVWLRKKRNRELGVQTPSSRRSNARQMVKKIKNAET